MFQQPTIIVDITQLNGGQFGTVKGSDVYPAVDVTDVTQAPTGTTKPYQVSQLSAYVLAAFGFTVYNQVITATMTNVPATYNNGISGVGATLTNAGTLAPFSANGQAGVLNGRYLVNSETNPAWNGLYSLTTLGDSIITKWVLTRPVDFNSAGNIINDGLVYVATGTVDAGTWWQVTFTGSVTVGTTALNWNLFSLNESTIPSFPLSLANGGTGTTLMASNGGIVYSNASTLAILAGTATANEILVSGMNAAPSWAGLSSLIDVVIGSVQGDVLYRNATGWVALGHGTAGQVLTTGGAAANVAWTSAPGTGDLLAANNLSDVASAITSLYNLRTAGDDVHAINAITTLTASDFGKKVVCSGASAYPVTLPTVTSNAYRYIDIQVVTTSNALITLTPASGTIQTQSVFVLGTGESCRVWTDGTNWWVEGLTLMPVSFLENLSTGQTIASGTATKLALATPVYDVGSFFNNSTYTYTPLYPGKYKFYINVLWTSTTTSGGVESYIYLNGSAIAANLFYGTQTTQNAPPMEITIEMNGSTDYVQFFVYQDSGSNGTVSATATNTFCGGFRLSNF